MADSDLNRAALRQWRTEAPVHTASHCTEVLGTTDRSSSRPAHVTLDVSHIGSLRAEPLIARP